MASRARGVAPVAEVSLFFCDGDPNGVVIANTGGDLCVNLSAGSVYIASAAGTVWTVISGSGGGSSATVTQTTVTGTTDTLALVDAGALKRYTNAAAVTVTVPANATVAFVAGTIINVYAAGAAGVAIAAAGGVTIRNNVSALIQYQEVSLRKDGTDEWVRLG